MFQSVLFLDGFRNQSYFLLVMKLGFKAPE